MRLLRNRSASPKGFGSPLGRRSPGAAAAEPELGDNFLFETLLRFAPDQIYFKDDQSRFVKVSSVIADRFGVPPEAVIGKTDAEFLALEAAEGFRAEEKAIMSGGAALIDVEQEEMFEDGRIGWNS